jgi:N-acylneuraminate cytidylyltransferase
MLKIVTIIPARGGSKSLPKKNILPLNNKPLLCYSIDYSKNNSIVNRTIVTTDSQEIADIAKDCGADIPFLRPSKYAQDDTRDYPFMRHALDYFESIGEVYDIYILLRPTSPIRPIGLIEKAIKIFEDNPSATSVRSIAKIKEHPYRAWEINQDGSMEGFVKGIDESYNIPRQELPEVYFQTGDLEAMRRETILDGSISGNNVYPLTINHDEMVDIDEVSDFKKAEDKLK